MINKCYLSVAYIYGLLVLVLKHKFTSFSSLFKKRKLFLASNLQVLSFHSYFQLVLKLFYSSSSFFLTSLLELHFIFYSIGSCKRVFVISLDHQELCNLNRLVLPLAQRVELVELCTPILCGPSCNPFVKDPLEDSKILHNGEGRDVERWLEPRNNSLCL